MYVLVRVGEHFWMIAPCLNHSSVLAVSEVVTQKSTQLLNMDTDSLAQQINSLECVHMNIHTHYWWCADTVWSYYFTFFQVSTFSDFTLKNCQQFYCHSVCLPPGRVIVRAYFSPQRLAAHFNSHMQSHLATVQPVD